MSLSKLSLQHADKRPSRDERGIVLLELAIALPIFVLLFLFSSEYVRALQAQQSLAVLSREAANAAFRDCIELDDMEECLDYVYENMTTSAQAVLPGAELLITIYTYDVDKKTGKATTSVRGIRPASGKVASGRESKITLDLFENRYKGFMQLHQKIAVAEIFFDFAPFFSQPLISREFYDAAIY